MSDGVKTVLLVEDEPPVREYVRTILDREGYVVEEARDGMEGLDLARKLGCRMGLVVTDIKMPRMDGLTMAEKVRELCPGIPVLLISGCASSPARSDSEYTLLRKPFRPSDLRLAVRTLVAVA